MWPNRCGWLVFALLGAGMLGTLGLIAGLWAEKFDQMAAFQNFIIMPMTFLSGVFYSVHSLPGFWQAVSHLNPFFYMIDGFRHGFFGVSDVSPWISLAVVALRGGSSIALRLLALHLLRTGYKLRHQKACPFGRCRLPTHHGDPTPPSSAQGWPASISTVEGDGRQFLRDHRLGRVRGLPARAPPPARYRPWAMAHARGDPRPVDEDADAGRMGAGSSTAAASHPLVMNDPRGMGRGRLACPSGVWIVRRPCQRAPGPSPAMPMDKLLIRGGRRSRARSPSPARRTPPCPSCAPRCSRRAGHARQRAAACRTSRRR